ncbi:MAG: 2-oxoacid:acceptor oxidoreductase family protein [Clostridia bacterium]|nr:2-oxoacid:acceptor oxidoreductase family protein [Clostridia bacterium]
MKKSFVFSGSGGQGIMSAGITLANTAIEMGLHATYLPEYGPEQRGGSAKCTVVVDDGAVVSPLPKQCDTLICMNELAYAKFIGDLKPGGMLVANANRIANPYERSDIKVIAVPVDDVALALGDPRTANIILLGILAGATGVISRMFLAEALKRKFGKKLAVLEMNIKALDKGIELAEDK